MTYASWLPIGYVIYADICVGKVLYSGENWQIVNAKDKKIMLLRPVLAKRWIESGLLNSSQFIVLSFGSDTLYVMLSDKQYDMSPIEKNQQCLDISDALAFANALISTRKFVHETSLMDGIYVESCNRLLPTYTLGEEYADDIVLGYWLTGGVIISVNSFRRLCSLLTWLKEEDVSSIIETAGFSLHNEINDVSMDKQIDSANAHTEELSDAQVDTGSQAIQHFSLAGRPKIEKFFNEHIIDIVNNIEAYHRMGIDFPTPTILYGPPGSGKTYAVEQLANFLDWPVFYIDSNSVASPYIHDTSKKIAEVFTKAKNNAPSIVVIDEMEAYLSSRAMGSESGMYHIEEVAQFLREIPNAPKNHVLVVGMTNMIEALDPAAIRQGRFDHKIEVGLPSKEEVAALIKATIQKIPTKQDTDFEVAIQLLTDRPFSDTAFMFREAGRLAVKGNKEYIDNECIMQALKLLPDRQNSKHKIGFDY